MPAKPEAVLTTPEDAIAEAACDPARLAALDGYGILDTQAEQGLDDLVLLSARNCATPVALVSLVASDRQWFKARVGFDPCETPLLHSVCAHALRRPGLLVIPDLIMDSRTRDNALVTLEPRERISPFLPGQAGRFAPISDIKGILVHSPKQTLPGDLIAGKIRYWQRRREKPNALMARIVEITITTRPSSNRRFT